MTLWATGLAACIAISAAAQPDPEVKPAPVRATRADLAFAYLEFEHALRAHPPQTSPEWRRVNLAFDQAARSFFSGGYGSAVQQVRALTASLPDHKPAAEDAAQSVLVRIDPPVWVAGRGAPPRLTIGTLSSQPEAPGAAPPMSPVRVTVSAARAGDRQPLFEQTIDLITGGAPADANNPVELQLKSQDPPIGVYAVQVRTAASTGPVWATNWTVAPQSMRSIRESNSVLLTNALARNPGMTVWVGVARERNELLADSPQSGDSARFLADLPALATQLQEEVAELTAGRNPYIGRSGDWWGTIPLGTISIPMRFYAPARKNSDGPAAGRSAALRPLIIVLHGAGGDESMFMDGYGDGLIKRLADEHGFVVMSPRSSPALASGESLDAIIQHAAYLQQIDPLRIYVIGHSLGAGVAAAWARLRPDRLAGVCCIAGFSTFKPGERIAPVLSIAAELDTLSPVAQVRRKNEEIVKELAAAGKARVEFREIADFGHTLVVARVLPEAVQWLLGHRLGS